MDYALYYISRETLVDGIVDNKTGKKGTPQIKDFSSVCTEVNVDIEVIFPRGKLDQLENNIDSNGINGVEKLLKLHTTLSTTNMHMFDKDCKLHKYKNVQEILQAFYDVRLETYGKRKQFLLRDMNKKLVNCQIVQSIFKKLWRVQLI